LKGRNPLSCENEEGRKQDTVIELLLSTAVGKLSEEGRPR
jgi:hypothetical protein